MARTRNAPRKQPKAPATAAGQALGYSLQFTRLTAMLLAASEGSACSLEVLDDTVEQTADGKTKLAQSKSALTDNPVADRSVALWKTLFNWLELAKRDLVVPSSTVFELYVSRKVEGPLVNAFHASKSLEEARLAIAAARRELWGDSPGYAKRPELAGGVGRYANPVLEADETYVAPIIAGMRLECGSGSPQADLEAEIRRAPVSAESVFDIADKLCGWVKRVADKQLERGLPAVIPRDDFHREYVSYVRSADRDTLLKSLAAKPSNSEKLERLPDPFVQQLTLIELSYDEKLEAISDFLQACWNRAKWSEAGFVHEDSFVELDQTLERAWRNLERATAIEAATKPEVERGRLLHARCMIHAARVQGMDAPPHFVPGCFHRLADDLVVGWHPAYKKRLARAIADVS